MILRFDIYNESNKFTIEQQKHLSSIMDKTDSIDFTSKNLFKLASSVQKVDKILKEFEKAFKSYGGNVNALEYKLSELKKNKMKVLAEIFKVK